MTDQTAAAASIQRAIDAVDAALVENRRLTQDALAQDPPDEAAIGALEARRHALGFERMRLERLKIELLDADPDLTEAARILEQANAGLAEIAKRSAGIAAILRLITGAVDAVATAQAALAGAADAPAADGEGTPGDAESVEEPSVDEEPSDDEDAGEGETGEGI